MRWDREPSRADTKFLAWGTKVGEAGVVRAAFRRCFELAVLVQVALCHRRTSKDITQWLLGLLAHPLLHRRPLMARLETVYC